MIRGSKKVFPGRPAGIRDAHIHIRLSRDEACQEVIRGIYKLVHAQHVIFDVDIRTCFYAGIRMQVS